MVKQEPGVTDSHCIAYSGMVPEPLLTHDPLPLPFRVYSKPGVKHDKV